MSLGSSVGGQRSSGGRIRQARTWRYFEDSARLVFSGPPSSTHFHLAVYATIPAPVGMAHWETWSWLKLIPLRIWYEFLIFTRCEVERMMKKKTAGGWLGCSMARCGAISKVDGATPMYWFIGSSWPYLIRYYLLRVAPSTIRKNPPKHRWTWSAYANWGSFWVENSLLQLLSSMCLYRKLWYTHTHIYI